MNKVKVLFFIPFLGGGGSERVLTHVLNHLNPEKFDVNVAVYRSGGSYESDLNVNVNVIDMGCKRSRYAPFFMMAAIWKMKPDVVFSFGSSSNILIQLLRPLLPRSIYYIGRENSIPSLNNHKGGVWINRLYKWVIHRLDLLICQSRGSFDDLAEQYGFFPSKMTIISNPVDVDKIQDRIRNVQSPFTTKGQNVVVAARLSREKNISYLLQSAVFFSDTVTLHILGQGPEEARLKEQVRALSLEDKVVFWGFQKDPYPFLKYADCFVLTSLYEGFPNVVLESLACGTPVCVKMMPGGFVDIMVHDCFGCIVNADASPKEFSEKLMTQLTQPRDSDDIIALIKSHFDVKRIVAKYEAAILDGLSRFQKV